MAKLLIRCERPYHSYIWPNARLGDKRWGDENLMTKLTRDCGPGFFSIIEVVDDRGNHIETVHLPEVSPAAKEAPEAPKRKRGRPKKVRDGEEVDKQGNQKAGGVTKDAARKERQDHPRVKVEGGG